MITIFLCGARGWVGGIERVGAGDAPWRASCRLRKVRPTLCGLRLVCERVATFDVSVVEPRASDSGVESWKPTSAGRTFPKNRRDFQTTVRHRREVCAHLHIPTRGSFGLVGVPAPTHDTGCVLIRAWKPHREDVGGHDASHGDEGHGIRRRTREVRDGGGEPRATRSVRRRRRLVDQAVREPRR